MFKVHERFIPEEISNLFEINNSVHSHEIRSSRLFPIPKTKTFRFGLKCLRFKGPKLWNQYHHMIASIDKLTKPVLKNHLKKYFLTNYSY